MAASVDEFEFFLEKQWSDGLPVVTPTEERVQRMLQGTRRDAEEVIGHIPPAMGLATVRSVAIHALMAGCKPEYLPVVIGGITVMLQPELNLNGVQATMGADTPLMIVNGPYAQKIGLNGGSGCFGPGFRANASIGRAIRLMLMNIGGAIAGVSCASQFASPFRYTACITENVAHSPWETLAVSHGYSPEDDVITCAAVGNPHHLDDDVCREPQRLLTGVAETMTSIGTFHMFVARSAMVVAMGPGHARICAQAGMSRAQVHQRLCEMAGRKARDLKGRGLWRTERVRLINVDPEDDDCFVPAIKDPRDLQLIVAGGGGPGSLVCHGWGGGSLAVHGTYEI